MREAGAAPGQPGDSGGERPGGRGQVSGRLAGGGGQGGPHTELSQGEMGGNTPPL